MTRAHGAPRICVWELTLACDAVCVHCGSSAGRRRADELSAGEALRLCDSLARLGTEHVTLSGGEPLLRGDWPAITQRLVSSGIVVDMISNGLGWTEELAQAARLAGIGVVSLSIDGPADIHDRLRGRSGAWRRAMASARMLREAGLRVGAVTQVCSANRFHLEALERELVDNGFAGWQVQLTMSLGRCELDGTLALAPSEVPAIAAFVLASAERGGIPVYAGDNLGWMTRQEPQLRSAKRPCNRVFLGCQAGLSVLGITSNGTVRGCLSMPPELDEESVRARPLEQIWADASAFRYNRRFDPAQLDGSCADCAYRHVCRGGCKSIAWASTGQLRGNPYCLLRQGASATRNAP